MFFEEIIEMSENPKHDFITIAPLVGNRLGLVTHKRVYREYIKMPDFVADIIGHPVKFPVIKRFY
jgi:hypothetical protein